MPLLLQVDGDISPLELAKLLNFKARSLARVPNYQLLEFDL